MASVSYTHLAYAVLGAYTIVVAYPILFMFFTSFKSNKEFFVNLFGLPQNVEIMNYAKAWSCLLYTSRCV